MQEYPHMMGLVIGVPWSGKSLPPQQTMCYQNWIGQVPMNFSCRHFHTLKKPIDEARNFFAEQAVEHGAKYLAMWDEDVVVPGHWMRQLIFLLEHHHDWAMIGGIYCQKNEPASTVAPMVFRGPGTGPFWKWRVGEVFEVDGIATGCSMIRVDALKDVEKPWFKTAEDFDPYWDNIAKGEKWTEDLWFCYRLKQTGKWKIFADGSLICGHMDLKTGKIFSLPENSYPMHRLVLKKGSKKIIDLGCGEHKYKTDEGDVVGADIRDLDGVDFKVDITKLPFETGLYDIVFSSHTLEHFPRNRVEPVLDEWIRILNPKGELRLILPNIAWAAERIMEGVVDNDVLNVLYGSQEYKQNFHKVGFTPETLKALLEKRGFEVEINLQGYNIVCRATRPVKKKKPKKKRK